MPRNGDAQHFLGIEAGPYFVTTGNKRLTDMRAFSLGACFIAKDDDAIGYAAHIDLQQRRFHIEGYQTIDRSDRWLDLQMVIHMLAIGCDGRVALGPSKTAFFDLGPEFCIQFFEDKDGIAYSTSYAVNDTITYDHATRTLFELHDIRFRTGFSGDVRLSDHLLANIGLHGSIGSGAWAPIPSTISLGLQCSCSVLFDLQRKGRRN